MVDISLTTFIDFAVANGPSKVRVVREALDLYGRPYKPGLDFYRPLRDAVPDHLRDPKGGHLTRALKSAPASRHQHLDDCLKGLRRWIGRKRIEVLEPVSAEWQASGLRVRVNPEAHVVVNGSPYLLKLYFKADEPGKRQLYSTLHLMEETCGGECESTVAVLDVRRGKLHEPTARPADLALYLRTEAQAFTTMWKRLRRGQAA